MPMRILIWLLRAVIFVALFGLAMKNSEPVNLRLYLDAGWQAPLSMIVLGCFAAGVLLGGTAALTTWIRQRHEIRQLRRQLLAQAKSDLNSTGSD